jgi:hypothetical protein
MKKPKQPRPPKLTDVERHKRFIETAKNVEASESIEDFDKAFSLLMARSAPKPKRRGSENDLVAV